jgi:hypothetical protein
MFRTLMLFLLFFIILIIYYEFIIYWDCCYFGLMFDCFIDGPDRLSTFLSISAPAHTLAVPPFS